MKNRFIILIVFVLFLTACSSDTGLNKPDGSELVLEIVGLEETKSLTMAELQAMETTEGWGGTKSSAGVISPPQRLKGVTITTLANLVGGLEPGMGISVVAKDGYAMTMSYEQIAEGEYITYDPGCRDW